MKTRALILTSLTLLLSWTLAAAAATQHGEHVLKVGKKGVITLTMETKVGDVVLQPGTYAIQHRDSGTDHFVRFVRWDTTKIPTGPSTPPATSTDLHKAGEIKCQVEPTAAPVKQTEVYVTTENGVARITKVAIRGEDVVHVF